MIGWRGIRNVARLAMVSIGGCAFASTAVAQGSGRTVFVPRAVIYPGDKLTDENLIERELLVTADNPPVFGEKEQDLLGKVARRTLLPSELIPELAIRTENLVKQGRTYKMEYRSKFVAIVGVGVPMQSGSIGEIINVRNPETGIIIKARVEPDQSLSVDDQ